MSASLDRIDPVEKLDVASRRVLVRLDLDLPRGRDGALNDDAKLLAALPTLKLLIERQARVVIAGHLGRSRKPGEAPSLAPVGERLAELLVTDIVLPDECVGDGARKVVHDLRDGRVALLENLRGHSGEEENDEAFAMQLERLCDAYVNEAFACSNRAWASVDALPRRVSPRAAGLWMQRELKALDAIARPARPFVAVVGGASMADKAPLLEALLPKVDALLLGGAVATTALAAGGRELGRTSVERERFAFARGLLERAQARRIPVLLPTDLRVGPSPDAERSAPASVDGVAPGQVAMDLGPETVARYRDRLVGAKTILWHGPVGAWEAAGFSEGTLGVARAIAEAAAHSVTVGASTAQAVERAGLAGRFAHLSTGGAASLDLILGKKLPGVEALRT